MRPMSWPSSVTPRGFMEAASSTLPALALFTKAQSRAITTQQTRAVNHSLRGVRTPANSTTPSISGSTVLGLSV